MTKFRRMLMAKKNKFIPVYYVNNESFEGDLNEVYGVRAFPLSWISGKIYHISFDYEMTNIERIYTSNYLRLNPTIWCNAPTTTNAFFYKDGIKTGDEYRGHAEIEAECINTYTMGAYWAYLFNNSASNMKTCHTKITNICIYRKDLIKSIFYSDAISRDSTYSTARQIITVPAYTLTIGKTYHIHMKYSCTITSEQVEGAGVGVRIRCTSFNAWATLFSKDMALGETATGTIDLDTTATREQNYAYLVGLDSGYKEGMQGGAHWELLDITVVEAE